MALSDDIRICVAHADVAMGGHAFSNVLWYWQFQRGTDAYRECFGGENLERFVELPGSLTSDLTLGPGHSLIVAGDVTSRVTIDEHTEVVIGGAVSAKSTIEVRGIGNLFVAGDCSGTIQFGDSGSGRIWIGANFTGCIETGHPSTELFVKGDFDGIVRPSNKAHLLTMLIDGFASQTSMERIRDYNYSQFLASVLTSDVNPGSYPTDGGYSRKQTGGRSFSRWTVRRKRQ